MSARHSFPQRVGIGRRAQGGQSSAEFLVAAVALVPLLLLVPMIGKYQAIAYQTEAASRYAAFDAASHHGRATSWTPADELQTQIAWRFFTRKEEGIDSRATAAMPTADRLNSLWHAPNGEALFSDPRRSFVVRFGGAGGPTLDPAAGRVDASDQGAMEWAPALGLGRTGIHVAQVTSSADNLPARRFLKPLDEINFSVTRKTALVVDGWQARDPDEVKSRLDDIVIFPAVGARYLGEGLDAAVTSIDGTAGIPLSAVTSLMGVKPGVSLPDSGPMVRGPRLGNLEMWTDVVPNDRLSSRK